MELTQHPEYGAYVQAEQLDRRCRRAVATWRASREPIEAGDYSLRWTFERALGFVRSLSHMFQEYNRVLWEEFPYCRQCDGKCCVPDATGVGSFDLIALALLDRPLPALPDRIEATARECIYLLTDRCAWPAVWRPMKCWSFYCALDERYDAIAKGLERVVLDLLPAELRAYEAVSGDPLAAYLFDPLDFAEALDDALFEVFVAPFDDRYPMIEEAAGGRPDVDAREDVVTEVLAFIAEAAAQAGEGPPVPEGLETSPEQLLADLELLEWIVLGHPEHGAKLLEEMYLRYARVPAPAEGERATVWYRMNVLLRRLSMTQRITITAGPVTMEAELNDGPTAQAIWGALPITGRANRWGDEIYFEIPVKAAGEPDARADVEVGELGYWPVGSAFCIFFGPTPASSGPEPRAASPVNIVGRVSGDATEFRQVSGGTSVTLDRVT